MHKFAKTMFKRFFGRTDAYGVQRRKGEGIIYFKVEREMTADIYYQHLMGEAIVGVYPLRVDGTTHFACVDVDAPDLEIADKVRNLLPSPNYLEISRSGNYHVWMFFASPVNAEELSQKCKPAVALGKMLLAQRAGKKEHCELYPQPQDRGSFGLLIALPLQMHALESDRTAFCDPEGIAFEDQFQYVRDMKLITPTMFKQFDPNPLPEPTKKGVSEDDILNDPIVRNLYLGKGKTSGDKTSSGYDFAFVTALADRGLSKPEATRLLCMRPTVAKITTSYIEKTVDAGFRFSATKQKNAGKKKRKVHQAEDGTSSESRDTMREESWKDIKALTREEYLNQIKELIIFEDEQKLLFDIFFATLMANLKTSGRPVWMFLVGPPGCGKTLPMMTVQNSPFVYVTSAFRPAALISGWGMNGGEDVSLIPKLNGKILLVKDMSSLLSQNKDAVAEILGLLRDAYDGSCAKAFGTGVQREYVSRFGFIGATTPEIDANWSVNTRLGERFLRYRIKTPPHQIYQKIESALAHLMIEDDTELKLEEICMGYLKYLMRKDGVFPPLAMPERIGRLAQLGAILRTAVSRAAFGNQVMVIPEWEEATRFAKQLAKMALALAYIRDKSSNGEEEFEDIKALVRDGIDGRMQKLLSLIFEFPDLPASDLANHMHLPSWTVRQLLQDLEILRIIVKTGDASYSPAYDFVPWIRHQLQGFDLWGNASQVNYTHYEVE